MQEYKAVVLGEPVAQGRPRFSRQGGFVKAYDLAKSRDYKQYVRLVASEDAPEAPVTGDSSEPHLINASMRCMMAFATATGRATMAERTEKAAPQVAIAAEEMAMLTGGTEARGERKAKLVKKVCAVCGKSFETDCGARKYCSHECRKEAECRQYEERYARKIAKKESMTRLAENGRAAREAGLSYGQYMAKKRMAKGEDA